VAALMAANPSVTFYWNDYENDPCLRVCSLAAQGLWMRMLCLAAKADPVGHVKVGPKSCTAFDLARLVGESEETINGLLSELDRAGVYSLTRQGTIFSRRMTRQAKQDLLTICLSEKRRVAGKKGGLVSASKRWGKDGLLEQLPKQTGKQNLSKSKPTLTPTTIPPKVPRTKRVTSLDEIDVPALEEWARKEAPNVDVGRELAKARVWTRSKEHRHKDALAFMRKWLINAAGDADPAPEEPSPQDTRFPPGSTIARAIDRALTRLEKAKATEIYRLAETSMPDAERLAATYLGEAA
jgi:hypothetical protein